MTRKTYCSNLLWQSGLTLLLRGKEFKRLMPEFKVLSCLNCRRGWKKGAKPIAVSEIILTTRNMGADGVDVRYDREVTTAEYIRTIRDDGLELHVWAVDDLADTLEAFQRGAQTVTTNCAKKLLDEYRFSDGIGALTTRSWRGLWRKRERPSGSTIRRVRSSS